jgi:hypothetical protein
MFFKKYGVYVAILLVCLTVGMKTAMDAPMGRHTLEILLSSSQAGLTEVYYDDGQGFAAERRIPVQLVLAGEPTNLIYELPSEPVLSLRWDTVSHPEGVQTTVHAMRIVYYDGKHTHDLALESVVPIHQVETFRVDEGRLYFEVTGTADDPYLLLGALPEAPEAPSRIGILLQGFFFSLVAAAIFSGFFRLLSWYFNS